MTPLLHDWGPSPFCLKIRSILEYKGVEYRRKNVLGRGIIDVTRRGKIGKVPALELDGELICDSTDIALALERRYPTPAILPANERARATCLLLEDWADEALYWIGIYYQWQEPSGRANLSLAFGKGPFGRAAQAFYQRRLLGQLRGQGTGRKPAAHVRSDLDRVLDAIDGLLGNGDYLVDDAPRLCDFAVTSQLVYLSRTPVGAQAIADRPRIAAYTDRMKALRAERKAA